MKRALRMALLVGIILNLINNPDLFLLSVENVNPFQFTLTFFVPFFVSLYSAVLANKSNRTETVVVSLAHEPSSQNRP
ncbi:MAG: hypothetical protein JW761_15470 [Prolixibacteraceae bacterium]|nr:hypothetical protein [Prolixibacteraceae bacterium]